MTWICPLCQQKLEVQNKQWQCVNLHSFDQAKEGYINLLPVQQKRSKLPGDSKEMIAARRQFLQQGHYAPLAQKLAELANHYLSQLDTQQWQVLDMGCGEGDYARRINQALKASKQQNFYALDIAKVALQKAAKANPDINFAVASSFHPPLCDASMHLIYNVFAPVSVSAIHRLLQNQGLWISVNPNPAHLLELKTLVYQNAQKHEVLPEAETDFALNERQSLTFTCKLSSEEERAALLKMTPYYWRADDTAKKRILAELCTVTADFDIRVFTKNGEN